ncbi:hypothetical protein Q9R29_11915 [Rothia sp. ARF10]|nr:hypothetical protein [Rothia sp. ARF10]
MRLGRRRAALRLARPPLAALGLVLALAGCGSDAPPPKVTVACPPGTVEVTVTNRASEVERYTVHVAFERAGDTEREAYSSNDVEPDATAKITDSRPDEPQTCSIERTEVFR